MFRTELKPSQADFSIDLKTPILSMGSCFAKEIGLLLWEYKFDIATNPGGILFNPLSIFRLMDLALTKQALPDWSFLKRDSFHLNYLLHSDLSSEERQELDEYIEELMGNIYQKLNDANVIILTFGTAFSYKLKANGELVANCHKIPQSQFEKVLLQPEEIIQAFEGIKQQIEAVNPGVKFLLTVSPVRHTREGLPENNVSKSILRVATHQLTEAHANVSYFPAYEIMMDDLRDYRFYKKDMIHPNEQAIEYIWEYFSRLYIEAPTQNFINHWKKLIAFWEHDPFNHGSEAHIKYEETLIEKLKSFSNEVDVSEELEYLEIQLKNLKNAHQSPD